MVFVRQDKTKADPSFNVGVLLSRTPIKGDVGIEIEVEGNKFPKPEGAAGSHDKVGMPGSKFWSYTHDGSLRGTDNAEYVMTKPVEFSQVPESLDEIFGMMEKYGSVIDPSVRTSVHVHLNCQKFHLNRLTSFMALYFTFEELFSEWCGEHRVGNLFCLRAKDAPAIISGIRAFIKSNGTEQIHDGFHYAGLNANALFKYGSLESRLLRGVTEKQTVLEWVTMLQRLYDLSSSYNDPREICADFSAYGPLEFLRTILGEEVVALLRRDVTWDDTQLQDSMYEGIRMAQDLCYCRDWSVFNPVEIRDDPFKRSNKKVAMAAYAAQLASANPGLSTGMAEYLAQNQVQAPTPSGGFDWSTWATTAIPTAPPAPLSNWAQFEDDTFQPEQY